MEGQARAATGPGPAAGGLSSAGRLEALRQTGLSAAADEGMQRFARLAAALVGVPVALVSLVEQDRQVFPGLIGLDGPRAASRQTPLSHSLCQHVAASGAPLVLADARDDERPGANLAVDDLGVIAYAGMPLTDGRGNALGSLCAIDRRPRQWTPAELAGLADLAAACSAELQLRIASRQDQLAQGAAEQARAAAERAEGRAGQYAAQARAALGRSELLLRVAQDLADTAGLTEVRRTVRDLVSGDLKPAYVGLALADGQRLRWLADPAPAPGGAPGALLAGGEPAARAARDRQLVIVTGPDAHQAGEPGDGADGGPAVLEAAACMPLRGATRVLGVLVLGWDTPHEVDANERAVLAAIAGYTALAVERAVRLDLRVAVAREMQQAMLTDLPGAPGPQLAALYRPAAAGELVGGDWYDAYPLPAGGGATAVTVGDITGHDVHAATIMGQVRSMLRQAGHDRPGQGPAAAVAAVEAACAALSLDATGTLIHAHLTPAADGAWQLTWVNAGHPPPLLHPRPGTAAERLDAPAMLLWPGLSREPRADHQRLLLPGATLLLYTDGLVERRGADIDAAISRVAATLAAAPPDWPLPALLDEIDQQVTGPDPNDDVVLLAIRIPATPPPDQ